MTRHLGFFILRAYQRIFRTHGRGATAALVGLFVFATGCMSKSQLLAPLCQPEEYVVPDRIEGSYQVELNQDSPIMSPDGALNRFAFSLARNGTGGLDLFIDLPTFSAMERNKAMAKHRMMGFAICEHNGQFVVQDFQPSGSMGTLFELNVFESGIQLIPLDVNRKEAFAAGLRPVFAPGFVSPEFALSSNAASFVIHEPVSLYDNSGMDHRRMTALLKRQPISMFMTRMPEGLGILAQGATNKRVAARMLRP
jgi:hypothetical protein